MNPLGVKQQTMTVAVSTDESSTSSTLYGFVQLKPVQQQQRQRPTFELSSLFVKMPYR
jgi:hypothetical protein